jgi:hypothetical protein
MTRTCRRPGGLAVLVAAAAIGLAACTSGSSNPQVASLPASSHGGGTGSAATGSAATSGAAGNPTQLMAEWTACMRSHGDPNQTTPYIDANKLIHITTPAGFTGLMGTGGKEGSNSCTVYMNEVSQALGGGGNRQPNVKRNPEAMVEYAGCMRAHGIADFADPGPNGLDMPADANTPKGQSAGKICAAQVGLKAVFATGGSSYPGEVVYDTGGGSGANG